MVGDRRAVRKPGRPRPRGRGSLHRPLNALLLPPSRRTSAIAYGVCGSAVEASPIPDALDAVHRLVRGVAARNAAPLARAGARAVAPREAAATLRCVAPPRGRRTVDRKQVEEAPSTQVWDRPRLHRYDDDGDRSPPVDGALRRRVEAPHGAHPTPEVALQVVEEFPFCGRGGDLPDGDLNHGGRPLLARGQEGELAGCSRHRRRVARPNSEAGGDLLR